MAATICIDLLHEPEGVVLELVPSGHRQRVGTTHVRRRVATAAAVALGLLLAFQLAVAGPVSSVGSGHGQPTAASSGSARLLDASEYVVRPGDTLWSIASAIAAPGSDVRETVDRLAALNGGAGLEVGQRLRLR